MAKCFCGSDGDKKMEDDILLNYFIDAFALMKFDTCAYSPESVKCIERKKFGADKSFRRKCIYIHTHICYSLAKSSAL